MMVRDLSMHIPAHAVGLSVLSHSIMHSGRESIADPV
jgi:hypothetical protein